MKKFKYTWMIEKQSNKTWQKEIKLMGEEGWELVSVTPYTWETTDTGHSIPDEFLYYFKKEIEYEI